MVHAGYYIYPINYIAYDKLEETQQFADKYTAEEVAKFDAYIEQQLAKNNDIPNLTQEDVQYMRQMILTMYANPLKNKIKVTQ